MNKLIIILTIGFVPCISRHRGKPEKKFLEHLDEAGVETHK